MSYTLRWYHEWSRGSICVAEEAAPPHLHPTPRIILWISFCLLQNLPASQKKCKDDEFQQFPVRLLDWFLHLHEIDQFGRLDPNTNIKQKTPQERSMYATVSIITHSMYTWHPQGYIPSLRRSHECYPENCQLNFLILQGFWCCVSSLIDLTVHAISPNLQRLRLIAALLKGLFHVCTA